MAFGLVTVWIGIAVSYETNWPLGFFVGVLGAVFFLAGRAWATLAAAASPGEPAPPPSRQRQRLTHPHPPPRLALASPAAVPGPPAAGSMAP